MEVINKMEQNNEEESSSVLNKTIGNVERESNKLAPGQITIVGIKEETKKSDGTPHKVSLIKFLCKHPDKPEAIQISKIKVLVGDINSEEGQKSIQKTTWAPLDTEGDIQKGSAIDDVLNFFKVDSLIDLEGKTCNTVVESKNSSFLCLKLFD